MFTEGRSEVVTLSKATNLNLWGILSVSTFRCYYNFQSVKSDECLITMTNRVITLYSVKSEDACGRMFIAFIEIYKISKIDDVLLTPLTLN